MGFRGTHRTPIVRLALACAFCLATFEFSLQALGEWASAFRIPFSATILGTSVTSGAVLSTVAGLNIGDAIWVDVSNGSGITPVATKVVGIGDQGPN